MRMEQKKNGAAHLPRCIPARTPRRALIGHSSLPPFPAATARRSLRQAAGTGFGPLWAQRTGVAMHGRLKLRPPDAARRRQREEKLQAYRAAMGSLLGKRGELGQEVMSLTAAVLLANPDVGTCWNIRREALARDSSDWRGRELAFAASCLSINPKSYAAWHHRAWVLKATPPPGQATPPPDQATPPTEAVNGGEATPTGDEATPPVEEARSTKEATLPSEEPPAGEARSTKEATLPAEEPPAGEARSTKEATLPAEEPPAGEARSTKEATLPSEEPPAGEARSTKEATLPAEEPPAGEARSTKEATLPAEEPPAGEARSTTPPGADGERELCDRLLRMDPRNFHAWEHRRALGREADAEAELDFAGRLLRLDFSNFSAWHHRARLLAHGPPDPHRLRQELELIQSAVFTDPADQSAWVYLRCLLSRAPPPPRVVALHADRERRVLSVTFSRPVRVGEGRPALSVTSSEGVVTAGAWRSGEGRPRPSYTWLCDITGLAPPPSRPHLHFRVTWEPGSAPWELTLQPEEDEAWWQEPIVARELFCPELGAAPPELMMSQALACRQLLELEPQSRGCLLTLALLLLAQPHPPSHAQEIRSCFQLLMEADPLRRGFLLDAASRAELTLALSSAGSSDWLNLSEKELRALPLLERATLVTRLDVAGNRLRGLPPTLGGMRRLQVLDASRNDITALDSFPPLPRLEELRLEGNPISHASALSPLAGCPRLSLLRLAGTPLAAAPEAAAHLAQLLPRVTLRLT